MKNFVTPFLILILVLMLGILAACGGPSKDPAAAPYEHPLIGTWAWDQADTYLYIFEATGEGIRGARHITEQFHWWTDGYHLLMETAIGEETREESWTFVINNDVLTIISRQTPGIEFSYVRVN